MLTELLSRYAGPTSDPYTLDVLWTLYDRVLNVDPARPDAPDRDRFFLSKGHNPVAYYAVLAAKGFFPAAWLDTALEFDSPLGHHPDRTLVPGAEMSAGSLGHGLPLAIGTALGLRFARNPARVLVLLGDAELDEGSNHEAIAYAGATGLDSLTAIVADNSSASHGWPGGIASRFAANGWSTATVDGHDRDAIAGALTAQQPGRPHAVVTIARNTHA